MGFLLFAAAAILSAILYPIAIATSLVLNFWKTEFKQGLRQLNQQFQDMAASIDATGNVVCDDLFNRILIKKSGYPFGNRKETVSSVLGKNQLARNLTWMGWLIAGILNQIEKDHCINSIDPNV